MYDNVCVRDEAIIVPARRCGTVGVVCETGWGPESAQIRFGCRDRGNGGMPEFVNDVLLSASYVVCVRPGGGEYAKCAFGRARYTGSTGNDLILRISFDGELYEVAVYLRGHCAGVQYVRCADELMDDDFVVYDRGCGLFETSGMPFTGGCDGVLDGDSYSRAVNVIGTGGVSVDLIVCAEAEFAPLAVKRVRELRSEAENACSNKVRGLVIGYDGGSEEFGGGEDFVSVLRECDAGAASVIAGAMASCPFYGTLSGLSIGDSGDAVVTVSVTEARRFASKGILSFVERRGGAVLWRDVTASGKKTSDVRVSDEITMRVRKLFNERYRDTVTAGDDGVKVLKADIEAELLKLRRTYGCIEPGFSVTAAGKGSDIIVDVDAVTAPAVEEFIISGVL